MKILHISAANESTGAGKATLLTHKGLLSLGISSKILFLKSNHTDDLIYSYHKFSALIRLKRKIITFLDRMFLFFYPTKTQSYFSPGLIGLNLSKNNLLKWADVIHIHWANHGFVNLKELNKWNKPIVWTLRDMWAFTGGCHYSFSCEKFKSHCGSCPSLDSKKEKDISYYGFKRKIKYLKSSNVKWVAISSWMKDEAIESAILKNKNIKVIYSGVDSSNFICKNKADLRKKYGYNTNDKIVLIGAGNIRSKYKGFDFVLQVLQQANKNIKVITFGSGTFKSNEIPQDFIHFGVVKNEQLNELYSVSDLFFGPSIAEAMGKTFLEAQFSGIPVLCFKNTGPEDIVLHKITGYSAKYEELNDLISGFNFCLNNEFDANTIRNRSVELFDIKKVAKDYIDIYTKLL